MAEESGKHTSHGSRTVRDVYNAMSQEQQRVVHFLVGEGYNKGYIDGMMKNARVRGGGSNG